MIVDLVLLAEMMKSIDRCSDDELPIGSGDVGAVRTFFHDWADEIDRNARE